METRSPDYWQENLFSNHYVWLTPLRKENETRFEVAFRVPDYAFEVGVWQGIVTDKIYYGADSQIAQDNGSVSVTSVYARKDFRIAGLHLDHKVLLQWSTNHRVIPVPLVSAFLSYYYEFWAVRNVLGCSSESMAISIRATMRPATTLRSRSSSINGKSRWGIIPTWIFS